jgi:hypothetical protein
MPARPAEPVWIGDAEYYTRYGPAEPDKQGDWVVYIDTSCRRVPWLQIVACPG